jgi:hypothetical protein
MCGIFGFTKVNQRTRAMAPFLALAMEQRGQQSWGYAFLTHDNALHSNKFPDNIFHDWMKKGRPPRNSRAIIYHTRAASMGAITRANAHPFTMKTLGGGTIVGIHNGVVTNHAELNNENDTKYTVDSQQIWHHLSKGLDTKNIKGWGSTCCFIQDKADHDKSYMCFLRFNHDCLNVYRLPDDDGFVFCSEAGPIKESARLVYGKDHTKLTKIRIDTEKFYGVSYDPLEGEGTIYSLWKQAFGLRGEWTPSDRHVSDLPVSARDTTVNPTPRSGGCSITDSSGRKKWLEEQHNRRLKQSPETLTCAKCFESFTSKDDDVMCESCTHKFAKDFFTARWYKEREKKRNEKVEKKETSLTLIQKAKALIC